MAGLAVRTRTAGGPDNHDRAVARWWPLRRRSTPARVITGVVGAAVLVGCLATVTAGCAGQLAGDVQSIGQQDAPRVDAATGLYFSLNDMDAQVANVLLVGGDKALAADRAQDLARYAGDRSAADQDLQQATVSEAGNPAALSELRTVLDRLGQYQGLAADALLAGQQDGGAATTAGQAAAAAVSYFRQATDLMSSGILPAVNSITTVSANELDASYHAGHDTAATGTLAVTGAGTLLVAALVALQVLLAVRFRRVLNPAVAAATVAAVAFTAMAAARLDSASGALTVAKRDAFDSILALTQARAVGYDANADESRYLVDPGRAAQYQQAFLTKSQELAEVGPVAISGYDAALAADITAYQRGSSDIRFGGYLGAEFRNITFPGERAAAAATLLAYQRYQRDDRTLRALAATSRPAAVAYDTGSAPSQSDGAFNSYDAALSSVIAINQRAFTAALGSGSAAVSGWNAGFPAGAAVVVLGLALAGVRPRLAEYRRASAAGLRPRGPAAVRSTRLG